MRWEYKTVVYDKRSFFSGAIKISVEEFTNQLNTLGGEGWELVSMSTCGWSSAHGIVVVFKRQR